MPIDWYLLECAHYGWQAQGQDPAPHQDGQGYVVQCHVCPSDGGVAERRVVRSIGSPYRPGRSGKLPN
jgi:hypothetical protein